MNFRFGPKPRALEQIEHRKTRGLFAACIVPHFVSSSLHEREFPSKRMVDLS